MGLALQQEISSAASALVGLEGGRAAKFPSSVSSRGRHGHEDVYYSILVPNADSSALLHVWNVQVRKIPGYAPGCRRIAVSLLPERKESDLILYYYNVWKTRATPRARAWFTALEQVSPPPTPPPLI